MCCAQQHFDINLRLEILSPLKMFCCEWQKQLGSFKGKPEIVPPMLRRGTLHDPLADVSSGGKHLSKEGRYKGLILQERTRSQRKTELMWNKSVDIKRQT